MISDDSLRRKITRLYILLIIVIIACAASVVYITRVHRDIQEIFKADEIAAEAHEITNLKWQIVQLERENEYLRKENAKLNEMLASGA